jgi:hypothetical protein
MEAAGTLPITLSTLDDWAREEGVAAVDFMKLDTQGSELDIFRGGEQMLKSVRMLEVEVEFNELYLGQPLFGDIDRHLRERGFVLWRLSHLVHYGSAGTRSEISISDRQCFDSREVPFQAQGGQLFWGHAHYVRRETALATESDWQNNLRDACLAAAHGYSDLASLALGKAIEGAPAKAKQAMRMAIAG